MKKKKKSCGMLYAVYYTLLSNLRHLVQLYLATKYFVPTELRTGYP